MAMDIEHERRYLDALLRRATWLLPAFVLVALFAAAMAFYWLSLRPVADAVVIRDEVRALTQIKLRVGEGVERLEKLVRVLDDLGKRGILDPDAVEAAGRVMVAVARHHPNVTGIVLARSDGRELFLRKVDGAFTLRVSDVDKLGARKRVIDLSSDGTKLHERWQEIDYDPRTRPWYRGAMESQPDDVFWTGAYVFKTSRQPGITLAKRWVESGGRDMVVAMDLQLTDLKAITATKLGQRGYTALLDESNRLMAPPALPQFDDAVAAMGAVLRTPEELGLRPLAQAIALHAVAERTDDDAERIDRLHFEIDGEPWKAAFSAVAVGGLRLTSVAVYPPGDFSPLTPKVLGLLGVALAGIGALVVVLARGFGRRLAVPIGRILDSLARSQAELQHQLAAKDFLARLATDLQQCHNVETVGVRLLSALAERFDVRRGVLAMAAAGAPRIVATWGDTLADATPAAGSALAECMASRQSLHLTLPDDPAWRLRSGLGDMAPAEVRLLPVEYAGQTLGAVELALSCALDDAEAALLGDVMPLVGMRLDDLASPHHRVAA